MHLSEFLYLIQEIMCICISVCIYIYIYMCMCVCVCIYIYIYIYIYTGYTQKNGAVSKVNKTFISHLTGHNVHRQQQQLSKFLMRYQQFASRAYCGAAGPVSKMASQQEKAFCVLRFEVSRSVITVQRKFLARFRKDAPAGCVFSKPCTKLTLHCNHRSGHLKTEHTESIFLLRRHLGNWPRDPAVSTRSELLLAHEKLGQLPLLKVYVVPGKVRNRFLVNF